MKKSNTNYYFKAFLFLLMPFLSFAQSEIDPPPAAPIDSGIFYLALLGVVFGAYYFYSTNLKSQKNETKKMQS